ncbi:CocE/NonD family hydrolase [Butyrivibrio sp. MB2005]|uniref:CocE/NonD family hydrolase n=1 Tax=Butyrivibrio sp. MB2005 TaxID=1280678 RepID=UPI00042335A5|nr:CocE/NonD family hydrolase [Butyrivibrio sp. MB2005]
MALDKAAIEEMIRQYMEKQKKLLCNIPLDIVAEEGELEEVMIPSDDGKKLKTWFFFPKNMEYPLPCIAVRCCYVDQVELLKLKAREFNKRGFAFAVQWCRGINGSEGEWVPNINERRDGLSFMNALQEDDRIESVGYWGDSYLALTGWCMADAVPSKVKTMYLGVYGCFRHTSAYKDGMFRQDILTDWAMNNAGVPISADYLESAAYMPQAEVDEKLWGVKLDWYRDWITHTDRNDPYWEEGFWGMLKEIPGKVKIPVCVRQGWYDHHLGSAIETWEALSDETKAISRIEIGPWNHGYANCIDHQNTENVGEDAFSSPALWFDEILRKNKTTSENVRLYEVGADRWEYPKEFPVRSEKIKSFYLDKDKKLCREMSSDNGECSFVYDPKNPVMVCGAESTFHSMMENGSHIQKEADYRSDVTSFVSDKLEEEIHVLGQINVKLHVSSDAEDTAFYVKVIEEFEDKKSYNVRGSITTLAYRNDADARQSYEPGDVCEVNIKLWDIDWCFQKGSRIRLDITSSNFPEYSLHSNNAGVWSLQKDQKKAKQTIYTGKERASVLELPIA